MGGYAQGMPEKPGEQVLPGRAAPPRTRSSRDLASRKLRSGTTLPNAADAELQAPSAALSQAKKERDTSKFMSWEHLYQAVGTPMLVCLLSEGPCRTSW